jgi:hypothetical protein
MVHLSEKARGFNSVHIVSRKGDLFTKSPSEPNPHLYLRDLSGEVEFGSRYAQHDHYLNNEHGYPHFSCFRVGKIDQMNILLHFQFSANLSSCLEIDSKI